MITRSIYLQKLKSLKDQHIIKVITGIRRCGKSTLLEAFQDVLEELNVDKAHIVSVCYEHRDHSQYASWQEAYDVIAKHIENSGMYYVFLDEVQMVPQFEKLVDALFVQKNIDLYITGSNAYLLSSELATLLSGRYIAINLHPFSFSEYVAAFPEEHNYDRLFREYINNSCFPEAVNLSKAVPEMVNTYLKSLYETVVIKDIVQHNKLRKYANIQNIIQFLYDSVGSVVSPNNIAERLTEYNGEHISHNTVKKIIDFLTQSYLIYPVRLYNIKGKRLLASNYKYYLVDLGLKNILHSNHYDADLGHKLENVVYFELLRRGGEVYAGKSQQGEVDFVVHKPNGLVEYYQVAFTVNDEKTFNREISSLRRIRDSFPKFLLTMDYDEAMIDGIKKINVIDWLLALNK